MSRLQQVRSGKAAAYLCAAEPIMVPKRKQTCIGERCHLEDHVGFEMFPAFTFCYMELEAIAVRWVGCSTIAACWSPVDEQLSTKA